MRAEQPLERDCEWSRRRRHTWAQRPYVVYITLLPHFSPYPGWVPDKRTDAKRRARGGL